MDYNGECRHGRGRGEQRQSREPLVRLADRLVLFAAAD
jgi:hypothetical protein